MLVARDKDARRQIRERLAPFDLIRIRDCGKADCRWKNC